MRALLPNSLKEAMAMITAEPSPPTPMAGATDLLVHWPVLGAARDRTYLDLSALRELRTIRWDNGRLTLGAMTTYWDVVRDDRIGKEFPLLVAAARQVGAIQIQARGTWAGNIANASPAADGVPVLMAYDATAELISPDGKTSEVALDRFYSGYKQMAMRKDQLITAIHLPRRAHSFGVFEKVGARRAQTITKVGVAAAHSDAGWRIVVNSVAPTIRRCRTLERFLDAGGSGKPAHRPDDLVPLLAPDISPIDDIRSTAAYRRTVLARLIYHHLRGRTPAIV